MAENEKTIEKLLRKDIQGLKERKPIVDFFTNQCLKEVQKLHRDLEYVEFKEHIRTEGLNISEEVNQ